MWTGKQTVDAGNKPQEICKWSGVVIIGIKHAPDKAVIEWCQPP